MNRALKIAAYIHRDVVLNPTGISMLALNIVRRLARNPEVEFRLLASRDKLEHALALPASHPLHDIPVVELLFSRAVRESLWLALNTPAIDRYEPGDFEIYCSMETCLCPECGHALIQVGTDV